MVEQLQADGARLYLPRADWDYAIEAGLRMLVQRHLVLDQRGIFTPVPSEAPLLQYYANSIAHLVARARPAPQPPASLRLPPDGHL